MMRIGSLFSGIGGLELGLEWAGVGHTVWQVERDPYCLKVLAKHWPAARRYEDVCNVGAENLDPVDLICGGFPCQDISRAGRRAGLAGARSGLWYEYLRIVGELRPRWVIVENVASGAEWVDTIRGDLEGIGYGSIPFPVSAESVGAPHKRERIFVVARLTDSYEIKLRQQQGKLAAGCNASAQSRNHGQERANGHANQDREPTMREHAEAPGRPRYTGLAPSWSTGPAFCGVDDGLPREVDGAPRVPAKAQDAGRTHRLAALGNSVVPQCAEVIGWIIREAEGRG